MWQMQKFCRTVGASAMISLSIAASAGAAIVGPGTGATTNADTGDRLNIADAPGTFATLSPGTYDIDDFTFNATGAGNVIPFIARSTGPDTYGLLWLGSAVAAGDTGQVSTNPAGGFVIDVTADIYAGFYTNTGGRVAFADGGSTDHAGAVVIPSLAAPISGFSNPNLPRTYAFSITAGPTARQTIGPGLIANGMADNGDRLNIDRNRSVALAAGVYNVDDFSFNGTAAAGTVTPFLARLTSANAYETVWVGGGVAGAEGGVSVDPGTGFTLASGETLYAGFYTADGGRVAHTVNFGVTDHDNAFTGPTAAGQAVNGFSNADLSRTYAFAIGVTPVPEPSGLAVTLAAAAGLLRRRRRNGVAG